MSSATKTPGKRVLLVVASPAVSTTLGGPVGFWASELTHPWLAFRAAGYETTIASPRGGRVELDTYSDPRHESGYSAGDLISLGFLTSPTTSALLDTTRAIDACRPEDFDALVVCGGQAPMFTFDRELALQRLFLDFHRSGKVAAALCHGTSLLLHLKNTDGSPFVAGRTITGFANSEEDFADAVLGAKVMPFRIEDRAREQGANFLARQAFDPFALRQGNLITGQQQNSGAEVARLVVEALGR